LEPPAAGHVFDSMMAIPGCMNHINSTDLGVEMIYTLICLLLAFWLVGMFTHIGGGFIHTLLVLALVVFVFDLLSGRV
jgi:hypothetical protein